MLDKGSVVSSIAGHDKGRIYFVVKLDGDFAYVVDGKYRLLQNPKRKKVKHLKDTFIKYKDSAEIDNLYDYEIATYLKKLDILHN